MSVRARRRPRAISLSLAAVAGVSLLLLPLGAPLLAELEERQAYVETAVIGGGVLAGVVTGAAPATPPNDAIVNRDQSICGERKPQEAIIRADDGAIKNAVVYIQGIAAGKAIDRSVTLKFDNHACGFIPHVLAIAIGQRLEITNSDPVLHNTHAYLDGTQTIFNVALPVQNQRIPKTIRKPGLMRV